MMEFRKHPRIPIEMDVELMLRGESLPARAVQIGGGGMCVQLARSLPISFPVELTFRLPEGPQVRISGVIWWQKRDQAGIRFDYTGEARVTVENWVRERMSRAQYFAKPI